MRITIPSLFFVSWTKTIRARLTVYYALSLVGTFLVFIALVGVIVWQILLSQVDHHLQTVVLEAEKIWQSSARERNSLIATLASSQGMIVVVLSPDGAPLLETSSPDMSMITEHQLQTIMVRQQNSTINTPYFFTALNTRFATVPISLPPGSGVIAVGYSLKVLNQAFGELFFVLIALLFVFMVPIAFIGYFLARRAFEPVSTIVATAQNISSSKDLGGRIPSRVSHDEIGQLIKTLNSMFDRLEKTFFREQQFFADAAHTLKTPLTVIRTQIESLKREKEVKREKLDQLLSQIDHASELVGDLLLLGRVEAGIGKEKRIIDLSSLLIKVAELTRTLAGEKQIAVESKIAKGLKVIGDETLMLRALTNVIDNAIVYTPNGGVIILSGERSGDKIVISVSDTGVGVASLDLPHVFERFYRTKKNTSGTGLGLSISKAITESFGGTVSIDSVVGKGTTVTFVFPRISIKTSYVISKEHIATEKSSEA